MRTVLVAFAGVLLAGCLAREAPSDGAAASDALPSLAWSALPDLPVARTETSAVAAGGKLWVLGGLYAEAAEATRVDVFDPGTGAWSEGPRLPVPLHHAPVVAVGDAVVVLGGYAGAVPFVPVAQTWVLDASAAEPAWVRGVPLPAPRGAHAAATDGERVWVFGGVSSSPQVTGPASLEASAWRLDPGASAWTRVADFPDPRDHLAGAFVDGKVVAVGGRDLGFSSNTGRTDVYDPATDAWSEAAAMPTPRGGLGAAAMLGRVVAVGGEGDAGTFDEVEAFDVANGTWAAWPSLPEARHGAGVAAFEDGVVVAGGGPEPGFTYAATVQRLRAG